MKATLALLSLLVTSLQAEIVLWKASGSITSASETFNDESLPIGSPVSIRMTYNDQSEEVILKSVLGDVESDFRTGIDLTLTIKIGNRTWEGKTVSGISALPHTFFTKVRSFTSTPESVTATVDTRDNGSFSSFPLGAPDSPHTIELNFLGPKTFLGVGIESLEIDPSVITNATGLLKSGSSQLQFDIEPASVQVLDLAREPVPPVINVSTPGNLFRINWRSSPFFTYRIERSLTLHSDSWSTVETINGTGAAFTRQYPRGESPEFYRIATDAKAP